MKAAFLLAFATSILPTSILMAASPPAAPESGEALRKGLVSLTRRAVSRGEYAEVAESMAKAEAFKKGDPRCLLLRGACLARSGKEHEAQVLFQRPPKSFDETSPYRSLVESFRSTLCQDSETAKEANRRAVDTILKCPGIAVVRFKAEGIGFGAEWNLVDETTGKVVWSLGHSQRRSDGETDSMVLGPGKYLFAHRNPETGKMERDPFSVPAWGTTTNSIPVPALPSPESFFSTDTPEVPAPPEWKPAVAFPVTDFQRAIRQFEAGGRSVEDCDIRDALLYLACLHKCGKDDVLFEKAMSKRRCEMDPVGIENPDPHLALVKRFMELAYPKNLGATKEKLDKLSDETLAGPALLTFVASARPSVADGKIEIVDRSSSEVVGAFPLDALRDRREVSLLVPPRQLDVRAVFHDPVDWIRVKTNHLESFVPRPWDRQTRAVELPVGAPHLEIVSPKGPDAVLSGEDAIRWRCWPAPEEPLIWWLDKETGPSSRQLVCPPRQTRDASISLDRLLRALPIRDGALEPGTYRFSLRMKKPDGKPFVPGDIAEMAGPNLAFATATFRLERPISRPSKSP